MPTLKSRLKSTLAGLPGVCRQQTFGGQDKAMPPPPRRVLVLRDGGLGDMILTAPILRTLRAALGPEARIDLMCRESSADVIEGTGLADAIHRVSDRPFRSWPVLLRARGRKYDMVIDMVLSASLSWAVRLLIAAPHAVRVGGDKGELARMYDVIADLPTRSSQHFLERLQRVAFSRLTEIPLLDAPPWLTYPSEIRERAEQLWRGIGAGDERVIWVNLSAGSPRRQWPGVMYRELIERLAGDGEFAGFRWVLSAAPDDHPTASQIAAVLRSNNVSVVPLESDFRVIIEMLRHADLILTPDTSMVHAASALGKPAVVLSVAENAVTWAPWKVPCEVVSAEAGMDVGRISVGAVAAAMQRMLRRVRNRTESA